MSSSRGQAVPLRGEGSATKQVITIILPGGLFLVQDDLCISWLRITEIFDLTGATVEMQAKVAPGTTSAIFRLEYSTNFGVSFAPLASFTFTAGMTTVSASPSWAISTLNPGDLLRFDVTTIDDGTGYGFTFDIMVP